LTRQEKEDLYTLAVANVQEQLAQGKTLDPNAPKFDHVNQSELSLQPVEQGYTTGTAGPQQQVCDRPSGQGTSRQGGSRRSKSEHCSPSPLVCGPSNRSPPVRRGSPGSTDSEEEETSDDLFEPAPGSSAGKRKLA
jgi:hypothetical protein